MSDIAEITPAAEVEPTEAIEEKLGESTSVLGVTFKAPGSAEFNLQFRNVIPTQMLAAGQWLVAHATRLLNEQWTMQAMQQQQQAQELARVQQLIRGKAQ